MAIQTITIESHQLKPGDVVVKQNLDPAWNRKITVKRDVKVDPFVPDLEVWRTTAMAGPAPDDLDRQTLDVWQPGKGTWVRYVRKDED